MLFTEPKFLFFFFPCVLLLYYLCPRRGKNLILLITSILFVGFGEGYYTLVILSSIVFNFFFGHFIDRREDPRQRQGALVFAVTANLALLFAFKYSAFFVDNINLLIKPFRGHIHPPKTHLPLGISFFTFHAISYLADIYRREVTPMKKIQNFALYIALFPQLIAGPIIRYKTIADQFALSGPHSRRHSVEAFAYGIRRFIIGLGKKMLIANILAIAADGIFATPHAKVTPAAAWLAVLCYTLQIYFDFSGYSDMAIGLGHMFGFKFPENFNYPYIATSVTEFWRRWHMSLSTWFRDYVYIPLGGNRVSPRRTYLNLLIVFFLCGFWHGATWNFIAWGLFYGFFLIVERLFLGAWLERLPRLLQHLYLLPIVMIGWVFFRAPTLEYAGHFLARMAFFDPNLDQPYVPASIFLNRALGLALAAAVIGSVPWLPALQSAWKRWMAPRRGFSLAAATFAARSFEFASLGLLLLLSAGSAAIDTYSPFIYFHF
jgi:alginate O-acetyltransferase complex protein AlgI